MTTTQVVIGPAILERITINVSSAYTIGVIDGTAGTTANVATIYKSATTGPHDFNCAMANGIRIVTTQTAVTGTILPDITVVYRQ